jgi:hypothetical protein
MADKMKYPPRFNLERDEAKLLVERIWPGAEYSETLVTGDLAIAVSGNGSPVLHAKQCDGDADVQSQRAHVLDQVMWRALGRK